MNYSRRQLEAFGEPLGESVTRLKPGGRVYGGGGGGPTSTTVTQSNIPDWLRPQVEAVLGGATKELFQTKEVPGAINPETGERAPSTFEIVGTKPFTPYSTNMRDYVAGFSPLQQQVQANAANLQVPGQFNQATGFANAAGMGGLESAQQALGYGNAAFSLVRWASNWASQVGNDLVKWVRGRACWANRLARRAARTMAVWALATASKLLNWQTLLWVMVISPPRLDVWVLKHSKPDVASLGSHKILLLVRLLRGKNTPVR